MNSAFFFVFPLCKELTGNVALRAAEFSLVCCDLHLPALGRPLEQAGGELGRVAQDPLWIGLVVLVLAAEPVARVLQAMGAHCPRRR